MASIIDRTFRLAEQTGYDGFWIGVQLTNGQTFIGSCHLPEDDLVRIDCYTGLDGHGLRPTIIKIADISAAWISEE